MTTEDLTTLWDRCERVVVLSGAGMSIIDCLLPKLRHQFLEFSNIGW